MEKIQLEVDKVSEEVFSGLSVESKKKLGLTVSILLKKLRNDKDYEDYQSLLNQIGEESSQKGLTEQLLNELLQKDD